MSKSNPSTAARRLRRLGLATGAATALVVAGTTIPAFAAPDAAAVVSPTAGPTGGGNTIAMTTSASSDAFTSGSVFVQFQVGACGTNWTTPAAAASSDAAATDSGVVSVNTSDVRIFSAHKLFITVPAGVVIVGTTRSAAYSVCVYTLGTTSGVKVATTATGAYTVADVAAISAVSPATGAAQGGDTITITGSNLASATASIDGQAITVNNGLSNGTTLVGTVPAHSAGGPYTLTVRTSGGNTTTKAATYTYTNGIRITPTTAPNTKTTGTDIDVTGVGFQAMDWTGTVNGNSPDSGGAHVYLVKGIYDPTTNGSNTFFQQPKMNGEVAECQDVVLISDLELICTLWTGGNGLRSLGALGTHTGLSGSVAAAGTSMTVTGGTLTQADVGAQVVSTTMTTATGIYIKAVTNGTTATLNKSPSVSAITGETLTLYKTRTVTDAVRTAASTTVTSAGTQFLTTDVGRPVFGTGIPNNDTIASVTNTGTIVLTTAATTTAAAGNLQIGVLPTVQTPIPNGTYTMTVVSNGNADVQAGGAKVDVAFSKSIISSGSTFTVADY